MAEYIEREAAIKKVIYESDPFGVHQCFGWRARDIEAALRAIPAADVAPVVRCRDCKHYRTYMGHDMCAKNVKLLGGREVGLCATGKGDFCNYGERKNDEL